MAAWRGQSWRFIGAALWVLPLALGCGGSHQAALDQTSPVAAVRSLHGAIENCDVAALRKLYWTPGDAQKAYAEAMADMVGATRALSAKASARFGHDDAQALFGTTGMDDEDMRRFRNADIHGDEATVDDGRGHVLVLHRDAGAWKIVPQAADIRSTPLLMATARAMGQVAGEISDQKKYPGIEDVRLRMQQAQAQVLAIGNPTTEPGR